MERTKLRLSLSGRVLVCTATLLSLSHLIWAQTVDYGKSYVNVSKGTNGGTNEPGDTIEVRATFVVKSGTAYSCYYTDNVPTNTTYVPKTLRVLTNEGLIFRQWTDASGDDPGTLSGTSITIRLGTGATATAGGTIKNTDKPKFGTSCIMVASYRIVVNASVAYGTSVDLGGGTFYYASSALGTLKSVTFSSDPFMVYHNYGICSNVVGANTILSESGGTFGSGKAKDRGPSTRMPPNYTYTPFTSSMPNDYYYGVSNNTSPGGTYYTTSSAYPVPSNYRVFSTWDVMGDHTGAANPLLGNPATDTVNSTGGYMLVVNSAYRTDTAFKDTVNNLCPNTYYQYTAWFRNIGPKGGSDSAGVSAVSGKAGYVPTGPGDSSGVKPNLTFNVNGYDYYTTGNIQYTGQWIQKGLTFQTGPTQTQMIIYIRNNAPGGGGNDWALDDIAVASCSPNISVTPPKPDTLCQGGGDTVRFLVSSYFSNYTEWEIEQSTDGGTTWAVAGTDKTGQASIGSSTPVYNSTTKQYEYTVARYYLLNNVNTLIMYRIRVASTVGNLSNTNCSFVATSYKIVHAVNCNIALPVTVYLSGQMNGSVSSLKWTSNNETAGTRFVIERSSDQSNYTVADTINGQGVSGANIYYYTDPQAVSGPVYYRVRAISNSLYKYSNIVLLSSTSFTPELSGLVNPFTDKITFEMTVTGYEQASFAVIDAYGRVVRKERQVLNAGVNTINLTGLANLAAGTYFLKVQYGETQIVKQVVKLRTK